ncbi:MAG: hypothetical protein L6R42_005016 [Xanthoria sp. 1 TBL-2021]|nr:MAG: hypothetical protein L6R42_005016 [Xanthoria sp. 1 TBL-2021]
MQPRRRSYIPSRRLYYLLLLFIVVLLWRWTNGWHRFLCATSTRPSSISFEDPAGLSQLPPGLHNPHEPLIVKSPTIEYLDLDNTSFTNGGDRVLILTPLRDASSHLETYFQLIQELNYPHQSIDLAFLVGDSKDDTLEVLQSHLKRFQAASNPTRYRSAMVIEKDFGDNLPQTVEYRHSFEAQGPRRKGIGRSRNYLLYAALKPEHKWVYWRDVDIVENPVTVIEDLMKHDRDVIVPNDYNSWQESWRGRRLRSRLDKNIVLAEGYREYRTHRTYLNWMAHDNKKKRIRDLHKEVPLDGIGGVNILVKADVHRSGINFPCYPFENQADTEGFAAMAKRAGYGVWGLPNYIVWHIDTEEKKGNMVKGGRAAAEKKEREEEEWEKRKWWRKGRVKRGEGAGVVM